MVTKAEIFVEQFEEGIVLRWRDADGVEQPVKKLAVRGNEAACIGAQIWEDLQYNLGESESEAAIIKIEYVNR